MSRPKPLYYSFNKGPSKIHPDFLKKATLQIGSIHVPYIWDSSSCVFRSPPGIGFAPKAALGADATALVADRPSSAEAEVGLLSRKDDAIFPGQTVTPPPPTKGNDQLVSKFLNNIFLSNPIDTTWKHNFENGGSRSRFHQTFECITKVCQSQVREPKGSKVFWMSFYPRPPPKFFNIKIESYDKPIKNTLVNTCFQQFF